MELQDRFYSAPEVANILGVTLRSLYRYIRSGKIETFKTAGGRLRFTRESIINFMGPLVKNTAPRPTSFAPNPERFPVSRQTRSAVAPRAVPDFYEEEEEEVVAQRPAGLQSSTRPAAVAPRAPAWRPPLKSSRAVEEAPVRATGTATSLYSKSEPDFEEEEPAPEETTSLPRKLYYQSGIKDLRLLAQKIQKSCQNAHVPYALTGYAGMSLHREMPPFSLIHLYVSFDDLPFFENILQCQEVPNEDDANLCLMEVADLEFWKQTETFKGFKVATLPRLEEDLKNL